MSGGIGARIGFVSAVAILAFTGVLGLRNVVRGWSMARGPLQTAAMIGVFLYGFFGLVSAYGAIRKRQWVTWTTVAWGASTLFVVIAGLYAFYPGLATTLNLSVETIVVTLLALLVLVGVRVEFDGDR